MLEFLKKPSAEKAAEIRAQAETKVAASDAAAVEARRSYEAASLAAQLGEPGADQALQRARKTLEQSERQAADDRAALAATDALRAAADQANAERVARERRQAIEAAHRAMIADGVAVDAAIESLVAAVRTAAMSQATYAALIDRASGAASQIMSTNLALFPVLAFKLRGVPGITGSAIIDAAHASYTVRLPATPNA